MRIRVTFVALALLACAAWMSAQPVFTGAEVFPPEEFAARRARVMAAIGDGVAVMQGTTERPGEQPLRQSNQFFYLTGVVEPRALVVIDGKTKSSTLFLQPLDERRTRQIDRMFGPGLVPGEDAANSDRARRGAAESGVRGGGGRPRRTDDLHAVPARSARLRVVERSGRAGEGDEGRPVGRP